MSAAMSRRPCCRLAEKGVRNTEINQHDVAIINKILQSGKDVVIRQSPNGISILSQKTELKKRKDAPKTE